MKTWKWGVLALSLFLMFGNCLLPSLWGLDRIGMATLCIFAGTMLLMILCSLTWPLFLSVMAFVVNDVYTLNEALSISLGHNLMWFTVYCCMLLYVLRETGVLRRMAIWLISLPIARTSPWMFLGSIFLATMLMGYIMDCTALIILYVSLVGQIFDELDIKKGDRFAEIIMIGLMLCTGVSYGATPIGHTIAVLAMGQFEPLGTTSFTHFIVTSVLMSLIFFAIFMLSLKFLFRIDVKRLQGYDPSHLGAELGPVTKEEIVSIAVFFGVVVLWLLPTLLQNIAPSAYTLLNELGMCAPVWIGLLILILVPVNGKPLMDFEKAIGEGVAWPAAFSMAVAMMLGSAITNPEAGVSEVLVKVLAPLFGEMSPVLFVFIVSMLSLLVTNFSSNTVAVMLVATITIPMVTQGVITGIHPQALAIAVGNCACFAFAAPPGGTYAAYTAGAGWVSGKAMFTIGGGFAIVFGALFATLGYQLGVLLY